MILFIIGILGSCAYFPNRKGYLWKLHAMGMFGKISQCRPFTEIENTSPTGWNPICQHGVLLWSIVEVPSTRVNQSVMPEINTFPRVISSVVVLKDKLSEAVCARNQPQLFRLGNTPSKIQNFRHLTNLVSVLAPSSAPVFKSISGANTGAPLLSWMSRSQKFLLPVVCSVSF